jgi:predicted permease
MLGQRLQAMLRGLRRRESFEADLRDEIQFHIDQRASDLERLKNLTREQALRAARLEFGGQESVREECRRSIGLRWIDELRQDLSYALRTLSRKPLFALIAIATLAIGIGGNTAMFTVLDAVILKTLPVRSPHQLFLLRFDTRTNVSQRYSWPFVQKVAKAIAPRAQAAAMTRVNSMRLGTHPDAPSATVQLVSGGWFDVAGVQAAAGRLFGPDDDRTEGAHPVAVVSASFWRQRFGGAPFTTGHEVRVNRYPLQIIGIIPIAFRGVLLERPVDIWVPLMMQHQIGYRNNFSASNAQPDRPWPSQDNVRWLEIIVRSSEPLGAVEAVVNSSQLQNELLTSVSEEATRSAAFRLEPFSRGFSNLRNAFGRPIYALFAAVTLVLVIVCANIANLLLARASERRREIAVRLSMGAGRGRIVRQMLTESLVLACCGAAAGLGIAYWATGILAAAATNVGATRFDLTLDSRVLAFTTAVAVLAAVLFGLFPALRATNLDPAPALKSGSRELHGGSRIRIAGVLVAAQVMLSVLLVSCAGTFLHSLRNLLSVDAGFNGSNLLTVRLDLNSSLNRGVLGQYLYALIERVNQLPGVQSSALSVCGLAADCTNTNTGFTITGYTPQPGERITFQSEAVTPGYFSTVSMQLISGREFSWRDTLNSEKVVIVNEALVRRYFGGRDPVGRTFRYSATSREPDLRIVGVVNDARVNGPRTPPVPMMWQPATQMALISGPSLQVSVNRHAPQIRADLRRAISEVDSRGRLVSVMSVREQIGLSLWREYLLAGLTATFGSVALFLACFGLYGVMSYAVSRRTAELGVRLALGADPKLLLWQTLGESLTLVSLGLCTGVPLSLGAERLVHDLLFDVAPGDPLAIIMAAAVLFASATLAAYLPAWRASRVDPVIALRYE